jgi:hypothetical protein
VNGSVFTACLQTADHLATKHELYAARDGLRSAKTELLELRVSGWEGVGWEWGRWGWEWGSGVGS